jgi:hypothetical protein
MQTRSSKSPPNSASGDDARTRVKWSKEQEVAFLDFLSERKEDMHNNTFQKTTFNAAVVKFNTRGSRGCYFIFEQVEECMYFFYMCF